MKMKMRQTDEHGKISVAEADIVPFNTLEEKFNYYTPNVPSDHPLHGYTIKVKCAVSQIMFLGVDELGNPKVNVSWAPVVAIE
jgi:hypothetical protein